MKSAKLYAIFAKFLEDHMWLELLLLMKHWDLYVTWTLVDSESLRIDDRDSRRFDVFKNQQ